MLEAYSNQALARALYLRAAIVLLDDALSAAHVTMAQDIYNRMLGPEGLLRKSSATVVFVTTSGSFIVFLGLSYVALTLSGSATFMKIADHALILDGNGGASLHTNPSTLVLPSYITEARAATGQDIATLEPDYQRRFDLDGKTLPIVARVLDPTADFGVLKFFFESTRAWMFMVWILALLLQVVTERFPGKTSHACFSSYLRCLL